MHIKNNIYLRMLEVLNKNYIILYFYKPNINTVYRICIVVGKKLLKHHIQSIR